MDIERQTTAKKLKYQIVHYDLIGSNIGRMAFTWRRVTPGRPGGRRKFPGPDPPTLNVRGFKLLNDPLNGILQGGRIIAQAVSLAAVQTAVRPDDLVSLHLSADKH